MGVLAGYLRVSHVGRRDPQRLRSPAEQTEEIERWAKGRGYRVEILPAELDAKGSDAARPIFRQAIEGVKSGIYEGVVVAYLSRAGRDLRLMLDLWDEVEAVGGVVYSARENIDGSTSSGRLQRNLLASIAQHELEERSEGFERATKAAVERGIWQRRQTPRGYSKDPETRNLIPDESAEEVRDAARRFLAGESILSVAGVLGMTQGGVRKLLRNRVYLGELKVRSYVKPDAHPAILDLRTFEAVQAKLDANVRPPRGKEPVALLAGLVRCASCGHVMTRGSSKGARVYSCVRYHSGVRCPKPVAISCGRANAYVEAVVRPVLDHMAMEASASGALDGIHAELQEAEAELAAYLEAVDAAGIGAGDAASGMKARGDRVEVARQRLRHEMARTPALPALQSGSAVWDDLWPQERNDLLRSLFSAVAVYPTAGSTVPVADRVRVFTADAGLALPGGRDGSAGGILPIARKDTNGVDVIGVPPVEDGL